MEPAKMNSILAIAVLSLFYCLCYNKRKGDFYDFKHKWKN